MLPSMFTFYFHVNVDLSFIISCMKTLVNRYLPEPCDGVRRGDVLHGEAAAEAHVAADLDAVVAGLAGDHAGGLGHHPLHPLHPDRVLDRAPLVTHSARVLSIICLSVVLEKYEVHSRSQQITRSFTALQNSLEDPAPT